MIEFAIGIALLISIIASRKLWNSYLLISSEKAEVWIEDSRNDLQGDIAKVHDKRKQIISKQGKWHTLDDLRDLTTNQVQDK